MTVKVSGFSDPVRVRAAEAKSDFPSRHDWDLFFMKNKLSENKPGERPDTIYLAKVPIKWFSEKGSDIPSEEILRAAMESFGKVRRVDIPVCDTLRKEMNPEISGFKTKGFAFGPELFFEAYVQYIEYSGFADAMDSLRNMKWTKRIDGKVFHANVKCEAERLRKEAERLKREEEERLAKEAADALRKALEERAAESKRFLELMFEHIQRKEDRRIEVQEARLRAERRAAELLDIPISDKEQHLRTMLLHQREIRMREKLKEKIRHAQDQKEAQQGSSEDPKQGRSRSTESRTQKCSSAEFPRESKLSPKRHQTRRNSSESSDRSKASVKKHRHRRSHKSKSDSIEDSDVELKRRKRKSKDKDDSSSEVENKSSNHHRRKSSNDSSSSYSDSHRSHRRHRHRDHKKSKKRRRSR
ncbi:hypothetical protein TELCIR_13917 [Teladorsagia circumcincta]|uniref:Uncharacterized protein n=1 Tax=Teladorsagia circumcincta TaxID=45464 RepID=A0A2G9U2P7_TELCI|nr:hypothetical protein TELCIR_13917 [Teladorsagia circumcincta]